MYEDSFFTSKNLFFSYELCIFVSIMLPFIILGMKIRNLMFFLLLAMMTALFCSCRTEDADLKKNKVCTTQKYLRAGVDNDIITVEEFEAANRNIESYQQSNVVVKYAFFVLFLVYMGATIVWAWQKDDVETPEPTTVWGTYLFLLLGGLWTAHLFHLTGQNRNFWWRILSIIIIIVLFSLNYSALMFYWRTPGMLTVYWENWDWHLANNYILFVSWLVLAFMFVVNVVIPALLIPYWVYNYNNRTFYKVPEHHAIMKGYMLLAEEDYKKQSADLNNIGQHLLQVDKDAETVYKSRDVERISTFLGHSEIMGNEGDSLDLSVEILATDVYRMRNSVARNLYIMGELFEYLVKNNATDLLNYKHVKDVLETREKLVSQLDKLYLQLLSQNWNHKVERASEHATDAVNHVFDYDHKTQQERVMRAFVDALNDVGECVKNLRAFLQFTQKRWNVVLECCRHEKYFVFNYEIFRKEIMGRGTAFQFFKKKILNEKPRITRNEFNFQEKKILEVLEAYKGMIPVVESLAGETTIPLREDKK